MKSIKNEKISQAKTSLRIDFGHLITPSKERFANILVEGQYISAIGDLDGKSGKTADTVINASNCYVTPGLFDLQVNGTQDCDLWDSPSKAQLNKLGKLLLNAGVTNYLPTLITDSIEQLKKNSNFLANEIEFPSAGGQNIKTNEIVARPVGIHLEGPCLAKEKPGVHPSQFLQPLSKDVLKQIVNKAVKLITLAPELDPSFKCIEDLHNQGIAVSLGHSNATFEEAQSAFNHGVHLVTHLFNAMPSIHHRNPGAVTAALLDDRVYCAIICDGKHLAVGVTELVLRIKGCKKTILVTDVAKTGTSKGNLVGSSILLNEAVKNIVSWQIATFADAIYMSTYNPAKAMGLENIIGQLKEGNLADIVIWDKNSFDIKHVIVGGQIAF
jgi:N-acetylglucosamine-6-phosphate deacetylase